MEKQLKKLQRNAAFGLWGSVALTLIVILLMWLSDYRFYPSAALSKWLLVSGCVMAVLIISSILLTIRKRIPVLRQMDQLETKLPQYVDMMSTIYRCTFSVVLIECVIAVISANNVLLMFVILLVLTLILSFPNMYKLKSDLGLSDEQMTALYGEKYVK